MRGPLRPSGGQGLCCAYGNLPSCLSLVPVPVRVSLWTNVRGADVRAFGLGLGSLGGWSGLDAAFALRMFMVRDGMAWHDMARDTGTRPELNIS